MKLKVLALVGVLGLLAGSAVAALQFDPNSVYADKSERSAALPNETVQPVEKGSVTVLRLNSYAHLGEFTVPESIQKASVERFNNKVYVLSEKPDKRLAGLWIGRDDNGKEGLCGYINNSMRIQKCYFILYREIMHI